MRTGTIILFLIGILFSIENKAQTADEIYRKFEKGYHTYQGITMPFYFFIPANYDVSSKYPLVLGLHGAGEKGDNPMPVENNSMAVVWARDSNQARWPSFILVPQCPLNGSWIHLPGPGSYNSDVIPISPDLLVVIDILDSLTRKFSIDTNRIYVTGYSMGGYGTWDLIVRYPDKFAAAIPMSAAGDTSKAWLIKKIPIWDFHGAIDPTIPVAGSREMMQALEEAGDSVVYTNCHDGDCTGLPDSVIARDVSNGAKHFYTEYEHGYHPIWDEAYNTPSLLLWTFSQSKANVVVVRDINAIPKEATLFQNYPNPFNPITNFEFRLPAEASAKAGISDFGLVTLKVYNILGKEVATIVNKELPAGDYKYRWNAGNLSSGVYFYRLKEGNFVDTKKLILMK